MRHLSPGLETTKYYFDKRHMFLSEVADVFGPNIGIDGRNLTISMLSLNRAALTVRLLESLKQHLVNFEGEVLIADNGSNPTEIAKIKESLKDFPYRWRLLEFGENFGVAGGRNRALAEVKTDWVMCLDNDIYFTDNPLPQLQKELALLGCHFISLPLLNPDRETLFSHGACLQSFIEEGQPRLTINPVLTPGCPAKSENDSAEDGLHEAFLSTFLFGGASVLKVETFKRLGGFDDNMLVGFEDIDFSLRLFREGYKIGTSGQQFLVHDHPKAETKTDDDYERARYSRQILFESAQYLERKTGYRIWGDEVDNWLRDNEEKQGWSKSAEQLPQAEHANITVSPRPRIALITDTNDWAFANISYQLKRYLGDRYDFEIISLVDLSEIEKSRWAKTNCTGQFADGGGSALGMALLATEGFDIVHVFWREFLSLVDTPLLEDYAQRIGMTYSQFKARFIDNRIISTSVYDHLFLEPENIERHAHIYNDIISGYYVSSNKLKVIYEDIDSYPAPDTVLSDGVDLTLFAPANLNRFDKIGKRKIIIGWVGHSGWASSIEDFKGVNTILKPAIEQLLNEGLSIQAKFADRAEAFIPHRKMPEYYAGIDVLVCTSKIEGTPNPVLEAMACGVPVISTDVGLVSELFGKKQKPFMFKKRTINGLKKVLKNLIATPTLFKELSSENLQSIQPWNWKDMAEKFAPYFDNLLQAKLIATGENRTKLCMLPFTTPSVETDGSIRLCSASSIFDYYEDTNMGNCREDGLSTVWTNKKYRTLRQSLLTGCNMTPYCSACEYRFDGPVWMMQLHMSLHALQSGVSSPDVIALTRKHKHRYEEYAEKAPQLGLNTCPLPPEISELARNAEDDLNIPKELIDCSNLPIYMDFNSLNRCNVSCIMCPPAIRFDDLGFKLDKYYRLTLAEYKKITAGVRLESAHFVGAYAEPLLNKEIYALVEYAHNNGAFTAITSNVLTLTQKFSEKLVDAGLDQLSISLHGATKEVAENIMRGSNFEKVIANIRTLQQVKKERDCDKPEIFINYVGQRDNGRDLPAFIDLAHDLEIRHVNFIHLIDGDDAVDKSQNLANHPDLLVECVEMAEIRAQETGVNLNISSGYRDIIKAYSKKEEQKR